MAVLRITIDKNRPKKDGSIPIRVAVSHKQQTAYITTRFSIDNIRQWSGGAVVRKPDASQLNMKLRGILDLYQETLDKIPNQGIYTCKQLKDLIIMRCGGGTTKTFDDAANELINSLIEDGRSSYASMLDLCNKYFTKFCNGQCFLSDITTTTIQSFKKWLHDNTEANDTTINKYLSHAKVIINFAVSKQYVSYQAHPFTGTKISRSIPKECDLSVESIIKIRDANPATKRMTVARALFLLSFYMGGMNLIDLMSIQLANKTEIEYSRIKTSRRSQIKVSIPIPEPAQDIIKVWINRNTKRLDFGNNGSYNTFRRYVDRGISDLKKNLGISENMIFYSARKTFSQFAADLGIPNTVIDYCLGHSNKGEGIISYYTKVKKQQASIAISRVVDYVSNPDKYKEFIELKREIMLSKL